LIYGYAFPFPDSQSVVTQDKRLRAVGAEKVFRETTAGRETRIALVEMIDQLRLGDVVVVTRLDRLARSPQDLANILAAITEKGARFHSLRWAERHRGGLLPGSPNPKPRRTGRAS
jgi:DNA invertase Pin-like site-specific DNA recombinase